MKCKLIQTVYLAWDLTDHPGLEHSAELLQVDLFEQLEDGGVRWPGHEIQLQGLLRASR